MIFKNSVTWSGLSPTADEQLETENFMRDLSQLIMKYEKLHPFINKMEIDFNQ